MSTDEQQEVLASIAESRGYTLEMHGIMAAADPVWVEKYNAFIEATYTGERTLDRKTKELLQVAVEAALRADVDQIGAHIRVALREGATPTEILEALQLCPWAGWHFAGGSRPGPPKPASIPAAEV